MPELTINGRKIGPGAPPYVIAELSGNHNGDLSRAVALLEAAAETGADAVKLQTYTPDTMTIDVDREEFHIKGGPWDGRTLYDLYAEAHTPWDWHPELFSRAKALDIDIFSTPFDTSAADFLEELGVAAYKIASFEATDLPLVEYVARKGKPMILSTGLANLGEIQALTDTVRQHGNGEFALLHCVSSYPAPTADSNVRVVPNLSETFDVVSGLSDHTLGSAASIAAIALGGCVIEKHMTLRRADGGPDAGFSLEPEEFAALVRDCRDAWLALGTVNYSLKGSEETNIVFRRSLYAVADIAPGEALSASNVRSIRPGYGLPPKSLPKVIGRRARRSIMRGEPLDWSMLD